MLEKNLVFLSTIASIATLLGLLGTVLGMIRAFGNLSIVVDQEQQTSYPLVSRKPCIIQRWVSVHQHLPLFFTIFSQPR